MNERNLIYNICILQVIGPILVILGHSLNGFNVPPDNLWWILSKRWIYIFHMPLFFMISGFLIARKGWLRQITYRSFMHKKAVRLLLPYLVWNLVFILPKFLLQPLLTDSVTLNVWELIKMFLCPRENIWGHTWYLVAAFLTYAAVPFFERITRRPLHIPYLLLLIILAAELYSLPANTTFLCIGDLHKDIPFFVMGCLLGQVQEDTLKNYCVRGWYCLLSIAGLLSVGAVYAEGNVWLKFLACTFILLALVAFSLRMTTQYTLIKTLAKNAFGIYIMHWPVMLATKLLCMHIFHLTLGFMVPLMIVAGYIVPNGILYLNRKIKNSHISKWTTILLGA